MLQEEEEADQKQQRASVLAVTSAMEANNTLVLLEAIARVAAALHTAEADAAAIATTHAAEPHAAAAGNAGSRNPRGAASPAAAGAPPPFLDELVTTLQQSGVLEEAARCMMLHTELMSSLTKPQRQALRELKYESPYYDVFLTILDQLFGCLESSNTKPSDGRWTQLCGRCALHLTLTAAVTALNDSEGGSCYGMPPALRRCLPSSRPNLDDLGGLGVRLSGGRDQLYLDLHVGTGSVLVQAARMLAAVPALQPPPGRRAALHFLLRVGSLARELVPLSALFGQHTAAAEFDAEAVAPTAADEVAEPATAAATGAAAVQAEAEAVAEATRQASGSDHPTQVVVPVIVDLTAEAAALRQVFAGAVMRAPTSLAPEAAVLRAAFSHLFSPAAPEATTDRAAGAGDTEASRRVEPPAAAAVAVPAQQRSASADGADSGGSDKGDSAAAVGSAGGSGRGGAGELGGADDISGADADGAGADGGGHPGGGDSDGGCDADGGGEDVWAAFAAELYEHEGPAWEPSATFVSDIWFPSLHAAAHVLRARHRGWEAASYEEWWRQFGAATRFALRRSTERSLRNAAACLRLHTCEQMADEGPEAAVPAQPSPHLAAALAGGMLPCLERLLRRAGQEPEGAESTFLIKVLTPDRNLTAFWLPLLAHGEPRQVAALVTTIGKLLRQLGLSVLEAAAGSGDGAGNGQRSGGGGGGNREKTGGVAQQLFAAVLRSANAVMSYGSGVLPGTAFSVRADAPVDAAAAAVEPAAAAAEAAEQRLLAAVCYAAQRWLPPLSEVLQRAARLPQVNGPPPLVPLAPPEEPPPDVFRALSVMQLHLAATSLMRWIGLLPFLPDDGGGGGGDDGGGAGGASNQASAAGAAAAGAAPLAAPAEWRRFLSRSLDVMSTVGAALRLAAHARLRRQWADHGADAQVLTCLARVGPTCPGEVLKACGATCRAVDRLAAWETDRMMDRRGGGGGGAAVGSRPELPLTWWTPTLIQALAEGLRNAPGHQGVAEDALEYAEALLALNDCRGDRYVFILQRARARLQPPPGVESAIGRLAAPDGVACGALRTCSNPGCVSLEGDSEAELPLLACAGCQAVAYCGRGCQVAHWRAGHRGVCAGRRRRQDGDGTGGDAGLSGARVAL